MSGLIDIFVKYIRTSIFLETAISIVNIISNLVFFIVIGTLLNVEINPITYNVIDLTQLGIIIAMLYLPFFLFMSFVKGFIIEWITPILVRWR